MDMSWLQKFCRDAGLMIHHVIQPLKGTRQIDRKTEQKKLNDNVTLRRTTIDEIEIRQERSP